MASKSPATTKTPARRTEVPIFEQISEIDDDGNFTAKIFGEVFTLSTDVNSWMLIRAGGGDLRALGDLVLSVIVVEEVEDENIEVTRLREKDRFNNLLYAQKGLTIERVMDLVAGMTEAAGNDPTES